MRSEWSTYKVEEIAEKTVSGPFGSNIKSAEYVLSGVPVIRGSNLSGPRFNEQNYVFVTEEKAESLSSSVVLPNDIVFVARGTVGLVGLVPDTYERYVLSPNLVGLRLKADIADPHYVFYYFRSYYGQNEIHAYVSTTGVPKIARALESLRNFRIVLPPLPEQRAIAHILGTLDDKIELLRRMSETLEETARAIFKAWFVDFVPVRAKMEGRWKRGQSLPGLPAHLYDLFPDRLVPSELGEIPEGWGVGTLGEISHKPQYGYTASAQEESIGPKFLRIKDINKLPWIEWESVPYCEIPDSKIEQYQLHSGDVLIARMADPGHGVVIEEEVGAVFASYLIRFRLRNLSYARYIQYWLRSELYWELVRARLTGTTRPNLNARVIGAFPLIIPGEKVVSVFGDIVDSLRRQVVRNVKETHTLAVLRDALLSKLIRGEIRVSEATHLPEDVDL